MTKWNYDRLEHPFDLPRITGNGPLLECANCVQLKEQIEILQELNEQTKAERDKVRRLLCYENATSFFSAEEVARDLKWDCFDNEKDL